MRMNYKKMNTNVIKAMAVVLLVLILVYSLNIVTQAINIIKPDVQSPDTYGGKYAYGHTGYSNSIASAYTNHEITSYKYVDVYGIYRISNRYRRTATASNVSTTSGNAYMYVSLPSGADYFVGSYANHDVAYLTSYWSDYTAVGEQYYEN